MGRTRHFSLFGIPFRCILNVGIGSPATVSGNVCTIAPLTGDNSAEAFRLMRFWLEGCLFGHDNCRRTMSGGTIDECCEPELPKRVFAAEKASTSQCVEVIETGGLRGHYSALGHCWGPSDKRPLRTTKATLKEHLNGIAFEVLPKTFQDAVTVTRAVGLQYLWIDSLCILQDDEEDWLQESARMGSLYEKARLTIAASGAKDPTEGCFISERPRMSSVEIPYYSDADEEAGSIWVSMLPHYDPSPVLGPLRNRAWAFQE